MASASSGLKNDRGPILTAVSIMLIILPTIGVGLRLLARRISTAKFGRHEADIPKLGNDHRLLKVSRLSLGRLNSSNIYGFSRHTGYQIYCIHSAFSQ